MSFYEFPPFAEYDNDTDEAKPAAKHGTGCHFPLRGIHRSCVFPPTAYV